MFEELFRVAFFFGSPYRSNGVETSLDEVLTRVSFIPLNIVNLCKYW